MKMREVSGGLQGMRRNSRQPSGARRFGAGKHRIGVLRNYGGGREHPGNNKAARRRLCADSRRSYGPQFTKTGTIPVAVTVKVVGVVMVDFT
jgi:hypothetical protein